MAEKKQAKIRLTKVYQGGYRDRSGNRYTSEQAEQMLKRGTATLAQWKGNKRTSLVLKKVDGGYEDRGGRFYGEQEGKQLLGLPYVHLEGQYREGRQKGSPNLKRVAGGFQNQYGVVFTEDQKKALERAVNKSNYQHKRMQENYAAISDRNKQLQTMGRESDFIISRQSKSLQQFKTMEEYDQYLDKQFRIHSGEYLDEKTRLYKRNHIKALENVFGDEAKDVVMKIRMMKPEEYRRMIDRDEFTEVGFVYDPAAREGKLNQIRLSLGMKTKEDAIEDIY